MNSWVEELRWVERRKLLFKRSKRAVELLLNSLVCLDHTDIESIHTKVVRLLLQGIENE